MEHFNGLTPAEDERLALLIEEAAEVIKAVTKIQRHGYGFVDSDGDPAVTNRMMLEKELGDLRMAGQLLADSGDVNHLSIMEHASRKRETVQTYLHHQ